MQNAYVKKKIRKSDRLHGMAAHALRDAANTTNLPTQTLLEFPFWQTPFMAKKM